MFPKSLDVVQLSYFVSLICIFESFSASSQLCVRVIYAMWCLSCFLAATVLSGLLCRYIAPCLVHKRTDEVSDVCVSSLEVKKKFKLLCVLCEGH